MRGQNRQVALAVLAGIGFAGFYICIDQAISRGVIWPLIAARATSLGLLVVVSRRMKKPMVPPRQWMGLVMLTGILDTGGNLFYVLAAREGRLDVAAVLASLYPAATLLLARFVLRETMSRPQLWGVFVALGAVLLIAV